MYLYFPDTELKKLLFELPYDIQPEEQVVWHRHCVLVVPHCTHDLLGCMLWGQLRDPVHIHSCTFTSTDILPGNILLETSKFVPITALSFHLYRHLAPHIC